MNLNESKTRKTGARMLFDQRCESCGETGYPLCFGCGTKLRSSAVPPVTRLREVDIHAAVIYDGVARDLVLALKQRRSRSVATLLGELLTQRLDLEATDVVTWAPTSRRHVRERGHDQARLIAAAVSRLCGSRLQRTLQREGERAQTGRSRRDRLTGPTFLAAPFVEGRRILVIDDVVTTGATLTAAHECLASRGAAYVACVAVAATPEPMHIR